MGLFRRLFGKKNEPKAKPKATGGGGSSLSHQDDTFTNPLSPLSPLNPISPIYHPEVYTPHTSYTPPADCGSSSPPADCGGGGGDFGGGGGGGGGGDM